MLSPIAYLNRHLALGAGLLAVFGLTLALVSGQAICGAFEAVAKDRAGAAKLCPDAGSGEARQRCLNKARFGVAEPTARISNAISRKVSPACTFASNLAGFGSFGPTDQPGPCWRPYGNASPFNTKVGSGRATAPGSAAMVDRLLSHSDISYFVAGDENRDWGASVYFSSPEDPAYTVECTEPWGSCDLEGEEIHLPDGAAPSGPWPIGDGDADSHLTVVDQENGWEYDFWNVRTIDSGRIVTRWGGKTRIDGDGLESDAVAAEFGTLAGIVRAPELKAGFIDHALALTAPCTVGYVAPATKGGLECSDAGMSTANALPMGAHLQLQMSNAEIQALNAPRWKRAILRAFATYGGYVEDTTGEDTWGLKWESANSTTSLGGQDGFVSLAKSLGMKPEDYNGNGQPEYWFDIAAGVDWSRLRVVG